MFSFHWHHFLAVMFYQHSLIRDDCGRKAGETSFSNGAFSALTLLGNRKGVQSAKNIDPATAEFIFGRS